MDSTLGRRDPQSNEGIDLGPNDPLPDIPDAGDDSVPITSPDPIDFSTDGLTYAGSVGMSTFNDGTDESLFERTVEAFEEADVESPFLGGDAEALGGDVNEVPRMSDRRGARIY